MKRIIEVYMFENKIKEYSLKSLEEETLNGIMEFIILARDKLADPNSVIYVDNVAISNSEELREALRKVLNSKRKTKVKIRSARSLTIDDLMANNKVSLGVWSSAVNLNKV